MTNSPKCILPKKCSFNSFAYFDIPWGAEIFSTNIDYGIRCCLGDYSNRWTNYNCSKYYLSDCLIELKPPSKKKLALIDKRFHSNGFFEFLRSFDCLFLLRLTNLAGIGIDTIKTTRNDIYTVDSIELVKTQLRFYFGQIEIKSCLDLANITNLAQIGTIFQLNSTKVLDDIN